MMYPRNSADIHGLSLAMCISTCSSYNQIYRNQQCFFNKLLTNY